MSNEITKKEKEILFNQVRVLCGFPELNVELEDLTLDVLLQISIDEYSSYVNDWLVKQQWSSIQNAPISKTDILQALTTKTLDFELSFTYAYSKQAGIGSNAPWELKKDYFVVSADTQEYIVPANREINEILWMTPPQIGQVGFTGNNFGLSPAWTATGTGWDFMGNAAMAILPSAYMYMSTQDTLMRKRILQSDLTYKITAGANGTKKVFLYPVPASNDEISGYKSPKHYEGSLVWYWYYDVDNSNRNLCLEENNDIIKLPSDVPVNSIPWNKLNDSAKAKVRRILVAEAKNHLGMNRGKFSGKLIGRKGDDEATLDYSFLLEQAKEEKGKIYDDLKEYLDSMSYDKLMEQRASIAESLNNVLKYTVNKTQFYYF
jgi:hypothetical protein